MSISGAYHHFRTITRHRHRVIDHCFKAGIGFQGLFHDLSKYTPADFLPGARYYLGDRSPNVAEREQKGYSAAWLHHKGRNRHHFEYWKDYGPGRVEIPVRMPVIFVLEMFCDRVAASKIYQKEKYTDRSALTYLQNGKAGQQMHPATRAKLTEWLTVLAEQGEEAAFAAVRAAVKEAKKKK